MAIPSGSGTEVAKMKTSSITGAYTLTPDADHILIILNIVVLNNHSSNTHFDLRISENSGSNWQYLLEEQTLQTNESFVWNDRIVLNGNAQRLQIDNNSTDSLHIAINYIEQDWS